MSSFGEKQERGIAGWNFTKEEKAFYKSRVERDYERGEQYRSLVW